MRPRSAHTSVTLTHSLPPTALLASRGVTVEQVPMSASRRH